MAHWKTNSLASVPNTNINDQLRAIKRSDFEHLRGKRISTVDAVQKYGIRRHTILLWVRQGHVGAEPNTTGQEDSRVYMLDEADVAYCAKIHTTRDAAGVHSGAPLLDDEGQPYLLKHPRLSLARRIAKQIEQGEITLD